MLYNIRAVGCPHRPLSMTKKGFFLMKLKTGAYAFIKKASRLLMLVLLLCAVCLSSASCFMIPDFGKGNGSSAGEGNNGETENGDNDESTPGVGTGSASGGEEDSSSPGSNIDFFPDFGNSDIEIESITSSSRALLSVVSITSTHERYYGIDYDYGYEDSTQEYKVNGSGVIYDIDRASGDAYIITNYHVVYHTDSITPDKISDSIKVCLYGQESKDYAMEATYIGGSMYYDLAVLKISNSEVIRNSYAIAATKRDSDSIRVMEAVVAIGNSEGEGISATNGIISVDSEDLKLTAADGRTSLTLRVIRSSAPINEGNSGGGLFDKDGRLTGILVAKKTGSDVDNLTYAIPSNLAFNIVESILHYCDGITNTNLYRCVLGMTMSNDVKGLYIDPDTGAVSKVEQVKIASITAGSPMEGKFSAGDIIKAVTVDGVRKEITRMYHVIDIIFTARTGSVITFEIVRDGMPITCSVNVPESAIAIVK